MPVIDFAVLNSPSHGREREAALAELDKGFQTRGFVYLKNHSVPQEMVDEAFAWGRKLFALPLEVKLKAKHPASGAPEGHRGYAGEGIGHTTQMIFDEEKIEKAKTTSPERKETFEMGNPFPESGAAPNIWIPEADLPGFRAFQERWWAECIKLQQSLLVCLGEVLQLEDKQLLCKQQDRNDGHMSIMYYPSMPIAPLHSRRQRRLNAHTDYGGITLLFQDQVGGLEIHDGEVFRPVVPKHGTVVLNICDMLERQTNGRWKSALHQVAAPRETMMQKGFEPGGTVVDRLSIAYFGQPNPDVVIDVLPGCEKEGNWKPNMVGGWSESMTCYEWLEKRYKAEFYGGDGATGMK
ncbi:hypothetical protein QQX98_004699 [Neonectria punicea]|uniref:Fe2OG dioxygenase domain-containing protein n=1 Tax=Neonectria punicea TaxID=979145 RepID=A0ABR1H830_9HYPO